MCTSHYERSDSCSCECCSHFTNCHMHTSENVNFKMLNYLLDLPQSVMDQSLFLFVVFCNFKKNIGLFHWNW
jgi:hypothetical protein